MVEVVHKRPRFQIQCVQLSLERRRGLKVLHVHSFLLEHQELCFPSAQSAQRVLALLDPPIAAKLNVPFAVSYKSTFRRNEKLVGECAEGYAGDNIEEVREAMMELSKEQGNVQAIHSSPKSYTTVYILYIYHHQ